MKTEMDRERPKPAAEPHRAVVRLRGGRPLSPETLLALAEGLRRALRLVGVADVQIELETQDAGVS